MKEIEAAKNLAEFFADGLKSISFIWNDKRVEGFWLIDAQGGSKQLTESEIESLLYLLDIYVNGE